MTNERKTEEERDGIITRVKVDAIYQSGVFKPLVPVVLPENQRVRLEITLVESDVRSGANDMLAWLEERHRIQQSIIERHGFLPDSTPDIAEDRLR